VPGPLLAFDANGTDVLLSSWTLPELDVVGPNVLLIGLVQNRPANDLVLPAGWTLRENEVITLSYLPEGIQYSLCDRFHPVDASPYHDTFGASAACRWSAAQLAFRTTGTAVPHHGGNHHTWEGAGTTNPSVVAALGGAATPGNVLVAYASATTSGPSPGATFDWPAGWTVLEDIPGQATFIGEATVAYRIADGSETDVTVAMTATHISSMTVLIGEYEIDVAPPPPAGVGWDVYAAADPNGTIIETIQASDAPVDGATARAIRVELNGPGTGIFKINRNSALAVAAALERGNVVKCRFPWRDDYDFAFLLETGDFTLADHAEKAGEELTFGGRGIMAYLERAVMWDQAFTTGLDLTDTWTEIWETNVVPTPSGAVVVGGDPTYFYGISETTRRIYVVRQSDKVRIRTSPVICAGYVAGISDDPSDATILWVCEAPWLSGSTAHTKIHKVRISDWAILATYDLGSAVKLTDIRADATVLWCARYDGTACVQKRSKADGSLTAAYTIVYGGVTQTKLNSISVNGSQLALWFQGTMRALIVAQSAPTVIVSVISTHTLVSFGGGWTTESGNQFFYPTSSVTGLVSKYQIVAATPHDPVNGDWRLDEGTPGAILARLMAEWQAPGRPQQPLPDMTYAFDFANDSAGAPWETNAGTLEFDAKVGAGGLATVLRLIPYGLTVQVTPDVEIIGRNADQYGTDRSSATFAAGKVRFEKGVNIAPELLRRANETDKHSDMLAGGNGGIFATAADHDLGYTREGFVSTSLTDASALEGTAVATLEAERIVAEKIALRVVAGNDELAGLYHPFTHYNVGDVVRVHTGTGETDIDEEDFTIYAISLEEDATGAFPTPVLELGSAFLPTTAAASAGASAGAAASSGGGGSIDADVTLQGLDSAGAVVSSATGRTIRSTGWTILQDGTGIIRAILTGVGRLLGLTDVNADGITNGQVLVFDSATGTFVPGDGAGPPGLDGLQGPPGRDGIIGSNGLDGLDGLRGPAGVGIPPTVISHGVMGATETFDYASGAQPAHEGTLDANCTLTFTGAIASSECILTIGLTQDATGGHSITLPASVLNKASAEAFVKTGAGDYTEIPFRSVDGGTNWYAQIGPEGPPGIDGLPGRDGTNGTNGTNGIDGIDGSTGPGGGAGPQGVQGIDGLDGLQGPRGLTGGTGADGVPGIDGLDGLRGPTGVAGANGTNGADGAAGAPGIDGLDGMRGLTGPAGSSSISVQSAQLGSNVAMTNANQYYDGPSIAAMANGTYIIIATVTVNGADNSTEMTAKLWDGTTVIASAEFLTYGGAAGRKYASVTLVGTVVISSGSPTWKISVAGNSSAGSILAAAVDNGAGNNASTIVAIKIA